MVFILAVAASVLAAIIVGVFVKFGKGIRAAWIRWRRNRHPDGAIEGTPWKTLVEWANAPDGHVAEIIISNVGAMKDSIISLLFRTPGASAQAKWIEWDIDTPFRRTLPIVLDVNEATRRLGLPLSKLDPRLADQIRQGKVEIVVVNARGEESSFKFPPPGSGPPVPTAIDIGPGGLDATLDDLDAKIDGPAIRNVLAGYIAEGDKVLNGLSVAHQMVADDLRNRRQPDYDRTVWDKVVIWVSDVTAYIRDTPGLGEADAILFESHGAGPPTPLKLPERFEGTIAFVRERQDRIRDLMRRFE